MPMRSGVLRIAFAGTEGGRPAGSGLSATRGVKRGVGESIAGDKGRQTSVMGASLDNEWTWRRAVATRFGV